MKYPINWPFWRFLCTKLKFTPVCSIHVYKDRTTGNYIAVIPEIVGLTEISKNKENAIKEVQRNAARKLALDLDIFTYKDKYCTKEI